MVMPMPKTKPKALGTEWETAVVRYTKAQLGDERIERRALHGAKDMGDIHGLFAHGYEGIIECKRDRDMGAAALAEYQRQTIDERENADADFALLVVKNFNHSVGEAFCWVTLRDLARIALPLMVNDGWLDRADETWVCLPLSTACALMRGDA